MYEPVAIVGTACRFPGGASSPSKLWNLLKEPRDIVKEFPPERLNTKTFYNANGDMRGRSNVRHKSYLLDEDIRYFDAAFFHINPKEAADMDPQQRMLLETVYEAFEKAGWPLNDVDGSETSVHVGVMTEDYSHIQSRDPDTLGGNTATGIARTILSNRISHAFNLRGPSLAVDTACSSSLVALHLAVQGLHRREATRAVVAGTNLLLDPIWYILESSMHMLSPDSRCRMWDKSADGYARGEGCAAVVLKTLSQAIRDGDPIECVIRGTGVNSDGHTSGITMPSPTAQATLIRRTYRDAGLDPIKDRCQYFECHGTGTQAGDPVEAQAIRDAFFPNTEHDKNTVMYCGSIKTVVGHLEGCAGLAGVIKASLAIQNKTIPPNMHFSQLNPKIEPFYSNLKVPTSPLLWPQTQQGPRRASVNSFGFGGTNAHAILESFEASDPISSTKDGPANIACQPTFGRVVGPFIFSAKSHNSLVNYLKKLLKYLRANLLVDLDSLSNTLNSKRSIFPYRVTIPGVLNHDELVQNLEDQINRMVTSTSKPLNSGVGSDSRAQMRILAIFTGQGAQEARMGYALLEHCKLFRESIKACETALAAIPEPPPWSLSEELAANATASHVSEARFSQPLCTAIQIGLVDLLRACRIRFSAVLGHSSGEISAAYAAGLLTRRDAIAISYYRGHVAHLARSDSCKPGGMMAVTMSLEAATAVCLEQRFNGRISVAASNAPSSVTISGDRDAIEEVKERLDKDSIQARVLRVDTAYHSHHMLACTGAYLKCLKQLNVLIQTPSGDQKCCWWSTVRRDTNMLDKPLESGLEAQYWLDNMVQPVLFSEALRSASQSDPARFVAAVEVGPHPALRGPVIQTLKQSNGYSPQYIGCLGRGKDAIKAVSEVLTALWIISPSIIDFAGWRTAFGLAANPQTLGDLPSYTWDHTQIFWRESRVVKNYRVGRLPIHDLLGRQWKDSQYEHTWRNTFRLEEMPWVKGHIFQRQVLFPATGYISLAVDAAIAFVKGQAIKFIDMRDMTIPKALPIGEGDEVEVLFTIRSRVSPLNISAGSALEADFSCYSYPDQKEADRNCHGRLIIHIGGSEPADLAPTYISEVELTPFNVERFYGTASELGFGYKGAFRRLISLNKCWGHAKAVGSWPEEGTEINCTLHPAILDVALQAGLSTFLSTAERSMPSPYLPVGIKRAIIDPNGNFWGSNGPADVDIEAYMTSQGLGKIMEIDINVCTKSGVHNKACGIQLEGVKFQAISEPQPSEDRNIFARTVWGHDAAYGLLNPVANNFRLEPSAYTPEEYERVALFYLQRRCQMVNLPQLDALQPHHQKLIRYIHETVATARHGDHHFLKKEWLDDSLQTITELLSRSHTDIQMALLKSAGEKNFPVLKEVFGTRDDEPLESLPGHFKEIGSSFAVCKHYITQLVRQVSFKFPRADFFHIGAEDSDSATDILDAIGDAYGFYTCTSSSEATLNKWKSNTALAKAERLNFRTFDPTAPFDSQGVEARSYDVVIVTDVVRWNRNPPDMLQNLRCLIRPGGFLISIALTGQSLRPTAIMGFSKSWWAGTDVAGLQGPSINSGRWDKLLHQSGFSGIDCIFHDQSDTSMHGFSVFTSQAVDDRVDVLRDPLCSLDMITPTPVIIIGGETSQVSTLIRRTAKILRGWAPQIRVYGSFDELDYTQIPPKSSVINLQDLEKPLFSYHPVHLEIENLKEILATAQNVLWVTSGRLAKTPHANIMIGIGKSVTLELPHLNIQYLDFDEGELWDVQLLVTQFLRLVFSGSSPDHTLGLLWAHEAEIVVKDSQLSIPRVVPDDLSNEIYNANRRQLVKLIDASEAIEIAQDGASSGPVLVCSRPIDVPKNHLPIEVKLSVALHTDERSPCFLAYGSPKGDSGRIAFTLSKTDSSIVSLHDGFDFGSFVPGEWDAGALVNLARFLIAAHIVSSLATPGTTLVCGSSVELAKVISCLAAEVGRKVMFVKITKETQSERPGWIYLHPTMTTRTIKRLIPSDSTAFYSLYSNDTDLVLPCLPGSCTAGIFDTSSLSQRSVEQGFMACRTHCNNIEPSSSTRIFRIWEVPQKYDIDHGHLSAVTNWERDRPVSAIVRGLNPQTLLSPNKTYFLVGMASELGQSLTYFLVRAGVRYIVLSSRKPKSDQHWIHDLRAMNIDIRLVKMDVTDHSQVREVVSMIRRTMPPIAGVANAALVLEAGVFANISAESIARQLKPKVHGTAHLDDEFKSDKLDFFITFGSLATVVGMAGQPIYNAGNAFMMSLVENRRRRGLAASILNFAMLVDVGYVARADRFTESREVEEWLRASVPTALSEADFHHLILQGIVSGRPESPSGEVIMGLEVFYDKGQDPRPRWAETALLSHMVRVIEPSNDERPEKSPSSIEQWQLRLKNANTIDEAISPVTELLSDMINSMIHISLSSIHPEDPFSRLGVDSINAINIRKWIWDTFGADISMVKILGQNSSSSIIRSIAQQYLAKKQSQSGTPKEKVLLAKPSQSIQSDVKSKSVRDSPNETLGDPKYSTKSASMGPIHQRENEDLHHSSEASRGASHTNTPGPDPTPELDRSERLSYAQAGIFYLSTFSDSRTSFNVTSRWRIDGPLNTERFCQAFEKVVTHHDALQICFLQSTGSSEVRQHVIRNRKSPLTLLQSSAEKAEADAHTAFNKTADHEYSLETGDTFQATLVSHQANWHTLVLGFHEINIDTISVLRIMEELDRAYQFQPWCQDPTSYLEFTRQQINDLQTGRFDHSIDYWRGLLEPIPDPLPLLPGAKVKTRQGGRSYGYHHLDRDLNSEFVQSVTKLSQNHGGTLMQFYLAAMQVFLCRLLNIDDIIIGVVNAGRDPKSIFGGIIGRSVSILPIRFKGILSRSFSEVLETTSQTLLNCLNDANVPFPVILEKMGVELGEGNMPLIQVAINYRVGENTLGRLGDCSIALEKATYATLYDLTVDVLSSSSGGHTISIRCTDDFYSLPVTEFITETFVGVLESIAQSPLATVKDYSLFSDAQLQRAITVGHGPIVQSIWPDSLSERFDQVASRFPDSIAVKDGEKTITYRQLRQKIGLYSGILLDANIAHGSRVAVLCRPSIDLYATMLAVFHIGGIFVPLDLSVPAARRNDMIKACKPDALAFHAATSTDVADHDGGYQLKLLNLTELAEVYGDNISVPGRFASDPGSDSYILFTSGTTSAPKAIKLHQRGMMSYAACTSKAYGFGQIRVLQQTSIGFDLSFGQIYNAFFNGGMVVVASIEARGDPDALSRLIRDENIEYTMCTPSEYSLLLTYSQEVLQRCHHWRFAVTAGEVLTVRLIDRIRGLKLPNLMLTNCYGPAETFIATSRDIPVHASASLDENNNKIDSIGHVLPNVSVYIISEGDGSLLPPGMPGEICIAGIGVANGYLDTISSQAMFPSNPFATKLEGGAFNTLYKSGDRGMLQEDGSVIFLGRATSGNTVVKLRGLRIDLNEVSNAILQAAPKDLADAAVTMRGDPQFLVCHVVFKPGKQLDHMQLISLLQTLPLPRYMVPSAVDSLERLPFTPNGKLDVAVLEGLPLPNTSDHVQDPADFTETETKLREIWIDLAGPLANKTDIGPQSCFFTVGGNSLLLVHLQHAINRRIGVKLPLQCLRERTELRAMATMVERKMEW